MMMMHSEENGGTTDTPILPAHHHRFLRGSVLQRPQPQPQRHLSQPRDRTLLEDDQDNDSPSSDTVEGMQEEEPQQQEATAGDDPIDENKPNKEEALDSQDDQELLEQPSNGKVTNKDAAAVVREDVEEPIVANGQQRLSNDQDLPPIHEQGMDGSAPVDNLEELKKNTSAVAKEDDEMLEHPPGANPSIVVDSPPTPGSTDRTEDYLEGGGATQSIPEDHGVGSPTLELDGPMQSTDIMFSSSDLDFHETDSSSTDFLDYEDVDDIRASFASSEEHIDVMNQYMGGESNIFDPEYYNTIAKTEIDNDAWMFEAEDATTGMNVSIVLVLGVLVLYFFLLTTKRVGIQKEQRGGAGYQPLEPGKTA